LAERYCRPYTYAMSKISTAEVERIAKLARIGLSPDEVIQMTAEIGQILEFVEQLQKVDVSEVAPTDQVTGLVDVWREDEVRPSMPREQLLANAPEQKDGYIVVKRVLNG
jgi:aspartyl-tRNA(Asn)/glutamyl-tRNA(Gln) amidotransferase subunit C